MQKVGRRGKADTTVSASVPGTARSSCRRAQGRDSDWVRLGLRAQLDVEVAGSGGFDALASLSQGECEVAGSRQP